MGLQHHQLGVLDELDVDLDVAAAALGLGISATTRMELANAPSS